MDQTTTGWSFDRGTTERTDDNGWVITEPTDNAQFVCEDHDHDSGWLRFQEACRDARDHFADEHPGVPNPFGEAS
jgi:hypothetical protein